MMDDLRHGMGEEPVEEQPSVEPEPTEHAHPPVFDRLSAYGQSPAFPYGRDETPDDAASPDSDTGDDAEIPDEEPHHSAEAFAEEETELGDAAEDAVEDDAAEDESEPIAQTIARPPSEKERQRRLALRRGRGSGSGTKPDKDKRVKKLVGLKIGASQIAAARVVNNGAPELLEVVREPLDPGVVVAGEIRDPEALAGALKRFFELHKLPKKGVRLGLSNNRIGVRVFQIEGVSDERQLENAIRFRAEEVLPIPLDEAVLDYVVLDESALEDGTPVKRILLVVAYRDVVERYLQACRGAGLEVVGIDLEAFALLRSLAEPSDPAPGGGALIAVAIGHDRTTIAVSTGRYCEFTRVLDWGGWSLNVAIARELTVAPSEVEHIKRQLSLSDTASVDDLTPEQAVKIREAVERALTAFARELVASLHFYQAQPGALGIGEVVLTGGTTHMPGLPEAVGRLIGVPVRVGDPFKRVKVGPKVGHEDQHGSLAVAIGLGIED
jgi:type IV pilus assembly protein PilM